MTVGELIEILKQHPENRKVLSINKEGDLVDAMCWLDAVSVRVKALNIYETSNSGEIAVIIK